MVRLAVLGLVLALALLTEASFFPISQLIRSDPFPEPKSYQPVPSSIQLNNITQRLDNFDLSNDATWEQRFYSNNEFYQPGGPIFVFLAGELSCRWYGKFPRSLWKFERANPNKSVSWTSKLYSIVLQANGRSLLTV